MARKKLDKTLADYVVIAISPALIMTLVCSLVFFLLEVCYRGQFASRMHWIMFWYVFAAVLVARIAMEDGRERAQLFRIVMCALAAVSVFQFVDAVIVGWVLLAVVWWCSSKLTWDCTLIDESEDASGTGLLQVAGFDTANEMGAQESEPVQEALRTEDKKKGRGKSSKKSKSEKDVTRDKNGSDDSVDADATNIRSALHAPGLWVIYFSLAALPLFGVGQLFIPVKEVGRRSYAFQLLMVYAASAIALLLTTSFLGLRRYLRQRKLEMPASMTRGWLGMGTALLVSILLLALIIPRPQGEYTLTAMIDRIDSKVRQASQFAVLKNDRGEGEGRRIGQQDSKALKPGEVQTADPEQAQPPENAQPGGRKSGTAERGTPGDRDGPNDRQSDGTSNKDQQAKGQNQSNPQSQQQGKGNQKDQTGKKDKQAGQPNQQAPDQQSKTDRQQSKNTPADQAQRSDRQDKNQRSEPQGKEKNKAAEKPDRKDQPANPDAKTDTSSTPPTSTTSNLIAGLAPFVKWILFGIVGLIGGFVLIRYWSQFVDLLAKLWAELLSLFGRKPKPEVANKANVEPASRPKRPFASYENPFFSGASDRMSPDQLICYTFEALEAWSRENLVERPPEQTALEFAQEIGTRRPALAKDVAQTAQLYARAAYSQNSPSRDRLEVLERLWRRLSVCR